MVHVVVEADLIVAGDLLFALPVGEEPVQQIEGFVGLPRRGVGTEVAAAILDNAAGRDDPGPFLVGDLQVGIRLAVFQHDVVLRQVALDQLVFENQRFGRGIGADDLEIDDMRDQLARLRIVPALRLEVGAHAIAQRDRLADVDDAAILVLHQIDAGLGRQRAQSAGKIGTGGFSGHGYAP